MAGKIKVPSELVPSQSNKIMIRSKYVHDDAKGHDQEYINNYLENKIDSKVIEAGGVTWDEVPTDNSNAAVKSKDIKAALEKTTGYFVLDSNVLESTVNKTVTIANFPKLNIGGSIKIKMLTKNTATNPTLRIGPSTYPAFPLYYNNERASANNSWEANEVISVYFDGTNYQASNAQGGSNRKIDAYLYNNVRSLVLGQVYAVNEAVKTTDKQLLRISKEIKGLALSEVVAVGNLRAYNNNTYKALSAVTAYKIAPYEYSENEYSLGSPTKLSLAITRDTEYNLHVSFGALLDNVLVSSSIIDGANGIAESVSTVLSSLESSGWTFSYQNNIITAIPTTPGDYGNYNLIFDNTSGVTCTPSYTTDESDNVTRIELSIAVSNGSITVSLGDFTGIVSVRVADDGTTIAESIVTALSSISGWSVSNDTNNVIAIASSAGNQSSTTFTINYGSVLGITSVLTKPWMGSDNISYYDGSDWIIENLSHYSQSAIWEAQTLDGLRALVTAQNSVTLDIYDKTVVERSTSFGTSQSGTGVRCIVTSTRRWSPNTGFSIYFKPVHEGEIYIIKANASRNSQYAFLVDKYIAKDVTPNYVAGTTLTAIPANSTVKIIVPPGANYMYISSTDNTGVNLPQSIKYPVDLQDVVLANEEDIAEHENDYHFYDILKNKELGIVQQTWGDKINAHLYSSIFKWISNGVWYTPTTIMIKIIPLKAGIYTLYMPQNSLNLVASYTLLTSSDTTNGQAPNYAPGYTGFVGLGIGGKKQIVINDGESRYLAVKHDNSNWVPDIYYYVPYTKVLEDIEYADYDITDITEQVGDWVSQGNVATITNYGHGNAHIVKNGARRLAVAFTGVPADSILRVRFTLNKSSIDANSDMWKLMSISDAVQILTTVDNHQVSLKGRGGEYDFIYNKTNYPMIGFSSNDGTKVYDITNFKLELLTPKSNSDDEDSSADIDAIASASYPMNSYMDNAGRNKKVTLLYFSDIHGDAISASAIYDYYDKNKAYINDMLFGGDCVSGHWSDGINFYTSNGLGKALFTVGNHDVSNSGGTYDHVDITRNQIYSTYFEPFIDSWGLPASELAAIKETKRGYYYKDYATVRLIVLDISTIMSGGTGGADMLAWFISTLESARTASTPKTVIVVSHYNPHTAVNAIAVNDPRTGEPTTFHDLVNSTPFPVTFSGGSFGDYLTAIHNFKNSGGNFAIWLSGHGHRNLLYKDGTYNDILIMAIDCCLATTTYYNEYGLKIHHTANLISVFTEEKLIKVKRVGRTKDSYYRSINSLVYSYKLNKVLYCD